jgi:hypothetical protein
MAVLTSMGSVEVYDERVAAAAVGQGTALLGCVTVGDGGFEARQVAVLVEEEGEGSGESLALRLLLAGWHATQGVEGVLELSVRVGGGAKPQQPATRFLPLPSSADTTNPHPRLLRLQPWGQRRDAALLSFEDGRLLQYTLANPTLVPHPHLPPLLEPCPWVSILETPTDEQQQPPIAIGLSERGRLYANEHCLAPGVCGSFLLHPSFGLLLYATLGSRPQLRMVPYKALAALDAHAGAETLLGLEGLEPRALERGARLVAACPYAPTVVVQVRG